MQFQEIVSDVKDRIEKVSATAQDVVKTSVETLKQANGVVVDSVQTIAKSQQTVAKELFEATKESLEKAREAGLKEVVAKPIDFVPAGRDTVVKGYEDTLDRLLRTGDELGKLFKKGYEAIIVDLGVKPKKAPARKTAAKKAAPKKAAAKPAAKKAAAPKAVTAKAEAPASA